MTMIPALSSLKLQIMDLKTQYFFTCSKKYQSRLTLIQIQIIHIQSNMNTPKTLYLLVILHLLFQDSLTDGVETQTVTTCFGTIINQNNYLLKRTEKIVDIQFPYALASNDTWTQFPDMAIRIKLDYDQAVYIKYSLTLQLGSILCTRVLIDGKENRRFRHITGATGFISNSQADEVWLPKGEHLIQVQYRTPAPSATVFVYDWNGAFFMVRYYQL